jgi:hypothetical protein
MAKQVAKLCLLVLVALTWVSWKLDGLTTPQVVCVQPDAMVMDERSYSCVLPTAALDESGTAVYVVESTDSYFPPLVARRYAVTVLARSGERVAVAGLAAGQDQVVLYADRALTGEDVPVSLATRSGEPGRVEVLCTQGASALAQAFQTAQASEPALAELEASWEGDRLILTGATRFTARYLASALFEQGLSADTLTILDYAWYPAVLAQSQTVWHLGAAAAAVWLLLRLAVLCARRERRALMACYLSDYLREHLVRLLTLLVLAVAGGLVCLALVRWLWRVELTFPTGFLPEGSLFDGEHYRQWWGTTFPAGSLSTFAEQLAMQLKRSYLYSALFSLLLLLLSALVPLGGRTSAKTERSGVD